METLSWLLALCEGNPPVTGGFHSQMGSDAGFLCFLALGMNKLLSKQSVDLRSFGVTIMQIMDSRHNVIHRSCNYVITMNFNGGLPKPGLLWRWIQRLFSQTWVDFPSNNASGHARGYLTVTHPFAQRYPDMKFMFKWVLMPHWLTTLTVPNLNTSSVYVIILRPITWNTCLFKSIDVELCLGWYWMGCAKVLSYFMMT